MKVAALQMVSGPDVRANLDQALALLRQARDQGAELAALPEYFCAMGLRDTDKLAYREAFGLGPIQDFLGRAARELELWIVGGTLPLVADDEAHVLNSSLVFSPHGECVARYDKIHLFHYDNGRERYTEAAVVQAGSTPVTCDITSRDGQRWRLGLSVCYDLRFPELYRRLAEQGTDLLLVPAAFTHTTGLAHWEVLLRARAIENQAYLLAPPRVATMRTAAAPGATACWPTLGHGAGPAGRGAGVVLGDISRERLAHVRRQLPALEHRVL